MCVERCKAVESFENYVFSQSMLFASAKFVFTHNISSSINGQEPWTKHILPAQAKVRTKRKHTIKWELTRTWKVNLKHVKGDREQERKR